MGMEQCNVAIQTVLPPKQIPAGTSLSLLTRSLGGSIGIAIGQNAFQQKLRKDLASAFPNIDPAIVSESGATDFISNVQQAVGDNPQLVDKVVELYNTAVVQTFLVALVLSSLTILPALAIEWKSVKKVKKERTAEDTEVVGNGVGEQQV
jgi:hypothetical protein